MRQKMTMMLVALLLIPCAMFLVACGGNASGAVPSEPRNLQAFSPTNLLNWDAWLSWETPQNDGGAPILFYEVWVTGSDGIPRQTTIVSVRGNEPSPNQNTITFRKGEIGPGSQFTFFVRAVNANGFGATAQITVNAGN